MYIYILLYIYTYLHTNIALRYVALHYVTLRYITLHYIQTYIRTYMIIYVRNFNYMYNVYVILHANICPA